MVETNETGTTNVYLIKPDDFDKKPRYEVQTGESLHKRVSTHCVIKPRKISNIESKLKIIAYHPLGGGLDGWSEYTENIDIIDTSKFSDELLLTHADKYAKDLAKRLGYKYFDLEAVKRIEIAEKNLQDAQDALKVVSA